MNGIERPSRNFAPRVYGVGAWTNHLHFGYDLVAALRPKVLVELGTDRGESYFAFCQSAHENATPTRCFAIDSWRGDAQAGDYDETTFRQVCEHNARYAAFSTLLRSQFDEAADRFGAATIDLLHLDGLHTEAAVRHDLEMWLPKLRPGGILLLHDVDVRREGFGVATAWDELRARGRSFTFHLGPGLGVWEKQPAAEQPELLETLFAGGTAAEQLVDYYNEAAQRLHAHIAQQWRDGSIRETAFAGQTIVQVFYSRDGTHAEEHSVLARVGHEDCKSIELTLPPGAGAAPLRVDFVSALTTIDVERLTVTAGDATLFDAATAEQFDQLTIAGDCRREPAERGLRLQITGIDPQLYLPSLAYDPAAGQLKVKLKLRITAAAASSPSSRLSAAPPSPFAGGSSASAELSGRGP